MFIVFIKRLSLIIRGKGMTYEEQSTCHLLSYRGKGVVNEGHSTCHYSIRGKSVA